MATYVLGGYAVADFIIEGGGAPTLGSRFMLDPTFSASTDAITITVTDGDTSFDGSVSTALDATQTAVLTNAAGTTLYSGAVRLGYATTLTSPEGGTITVWEVRVSGTVRGFVADGQLDPGVTYQINTWTDTTAGTAPAFSTIATPVQNPALGDTLTGGIYQDSILAGGGDDSASGGAGNDTIDMGDGNDTFGTFSTEAGADSIHGGTGNDSLIGGGDNDQIWGDDGNDTLSGGVGDDNLIGGAGDDVFGIVDDHNYDAVDGGTDYDWIWFGNFTSTQGVVVSFTGSDSGTWDFVGTTGNGSFNNLEAITATIYNDTLNAGLDANGVYLAGLGGNDSLTGGSGYDTLDGGGGNDTILGGGGADYFLIRATDGTDLLTGGETGTDSDYIVFDAASGAVGVTVTLTGNEAGSYSFAGGASGSFSQIEWLQGSALGDTINAAVNTTGITINAAAGNDSVTGGSGADHLVGDAGNDTLTGGAGNDTLSGGEGDDVVSGGLGDDLLTAYSGNDTVSGDDGNDYISALSGSNLLLGGAGADTLIGGSDNDTLTGGAGNDSLTTGTGQDRIVMGADGSTDTVVGFDFTLTDGWTADQIDTSDLTGGTGPGGHVRLADVVVGEDALHNAVLIFPDGERLVLEGVDPNTVNSFSTLYEMGIPCFVAGTQIDTPTGPRRIETLAVGDQVLTQDRGAQPVMWRASRILGAAELVSRPALRPVEIRAGALGNPMPLRVSAQHGVVLGGVLVRAAHLAKAAPHLARVMAGRKQVTYHHLLLPHHAALRAEGALAESLWPGPMAFAALDQPDRLALLRRFPNLAPGLLGLAPVETGYGPRVRPLARGRDVAGLLAGAAA